MTDSTDRVLSVMGVVFEMRPEEIPADAAPGLVEKWDSLRHLSLVLALEDEFGFRFTDGEMIELSDLSLIVSIVSSKLAETK